MIWSTTPAGTPTYVNKRFTDVIGATREDITAPDGSPSLSAIIHPDDIGAAAAKANHSFRTGVAYVMQYRQLRRGGSYRWTETRAEPLRDESGAISNGTRQCRHDDLIKGAGGVARERALAPATR